MYFSINICHVLATFAAIATVTATPAPADTVTGLFRRDDPVGVPEGGVTCIDSRGKSTMFSAAIITDSLKHAATLSDGAVQNKYPTNTHDQPSGSKNVAIAVKAACEGKQTKEWPLMKGQQYSATHKDPGSFRVIYVLENSTPYYCGATAHQSKTDMGNIANCVEN